MPDLSECPWEEGRGKVFFHFLSPAPPLCPYPYCFSPGSLSFPLSPLMLIQDTLLPLNKQLEQQQAGKFSEVP